jgi:hypothetical protein
MMMRCLHCKEGTLVAVKADPPWTDDHWQCNKCDSTYGELPMIVYDDLGNLTNEKVVSVAKELSRLTDQLLAELFDDGMSILEGRALTGYLTSEVRTSAILQLMKAQLQEKWDV